MTAKRIRWECPTGVHPAVLGSRRPPADSIVRYCLACSEQTGRLARRIAPVLERERAARSVKQSARAKQQRVTARKAAARKEQRENERFMVNGVDLREVVARYRRLPVFRGSRVARQAPEFTIRRATRYQGRHGFAQPWRWRIHVAVWPSLSDGELRNTIIHELCHLHCGRHGTEGWHGPEFRRTLRQALREAGLPVPPIR